jgi:hypothetical protein
MTDEREPHALALIVCDGIHTDPGTGKKTLLGLFSTVIGPEFPLILQRLCIYAATTECIGKTTIEIRIVDVNEERDPVFAVKAEIDSEDPLTVQDLAFFVQGATFPIAGEYRVQFFAAGTPIMERRLMAMEVKPHTVDGDDHA